MKVRFLSALNKKYQVSTSIWWVEIVLRIQIREALLVGQDGEARSNFCC